MKTKLSPHIKRHETACHCGCGFAVGDVFLLEIIEEMCYEFQIRNTATYCAFIPTSWCRCRDYNEIVQKKVNPKYKAYSSQSKHIFGMAVDFKLQVYDIAHRIKIVIPQEVYDYLNETYEDTLGLGLYKTFNHLDIRPEKARW